MDTFRNTGSVVNRNTFFSGRPKSVRNNNNHGIILEKILRSPKKSTHHISRELGISRTSVQRIIHDLGASPYKIKILQSLKPQVPTERLRYACHMLALQYQDDTFLDNIWFSDECHVLLSGHINKQNTWF